MIRPAKSNSWLDKLFPTEPVYISLSSSAQRRLQIIWTGLALLLALAVFLVLLFLNRNSDLINIPAISPTEATHNSSPGQPLELKIADPSYKTDPNLTVTNGKITSDSNYINVQLQVGGQLLKDTSNLVVYQVAFDLDQDPNTGFLYPKAGIGAEYLADFDSKGNALLLHWLPDEHRFETIDNAVSTKQLDDKTLNFEVSRAALGFPTEFNIVLLGADDQAKIQTFLPDNGYAHYTLAPQGLAAANDLRPIWPFTINTTQDTSVNTVEVRQPADNLLNPDYDIVTAKAVADSTTLTATLQVAGKIETNPTNKAGVAFYQLLLDTDSKSTGNFNIARLSLDTKYLADYDSNGFNSILHWLPKTNAFEGVGGLQINAVGNTLTYVIPLQNIGQPTSLNLAFLATDSRSSQQNYLPDRSKLTLNIPSNAPVTNQPFAVDSTTVTDKALQVVATNLAVKDGFLNATIKTAAPLNFDSTSSTSYQLLLGNPITQTAAITSTDALANNVIAPHLQVLYKVVFTPGISNNQAQLLAWSDTTQSFENIQAIAASGQSDVIALQVPLSVIGTGLAGYYVAVYNSQENFSNITPQFAPDKISLSGSSTFVLTPASAQVGTEISRTLVSKVQVSQNVSALDFTVSTTQPIQNNPAGYTAIQFWIDNDNNVQTGSLDLQAGLGVDYLLKFDTRVDTGQLQILTYDANTKKFVLSQVVPVQIGTDRQQLSFELPAGLLTANGFRLVVYATSPAIGLTQLLPSKAESFAQINFQTPDTTQTLDSTGQPISKTGQAFLDLQRFDLKYDSFFVQTVFQLSALPKIGDVADYSVWLTAFTPDPNVPDVAGGPTKLIPTYYILDYNTSLDRAFLKRWSEDSHDYQLVAQVDRQLDNQHNIIRLQLPYSLLGQPDYMNYVAGLSNAQSSLLLPKPAPINQVVPALNQTVATFYFKNPTNSFGIMKQIAKP